MEEERTNLVPRLQQDAYVFAAAQRGPVDKVSLANAFDANEAQFSSARGLASRYPSEFSGSSAFPGSVRTHDVVNNYGNNSYVRSTGSNNFAQGLPAAGIQKTYLADPFDNPNPLSFEANASLFGQPHVYGTRAFNLTTPTYAEGRYDGVPPALQCYSCPSNYNEHPFTSDAASIGNNTFATGSVDYTNGQFIANNPFPRVVSNNPVIPMDVGFTTEGPTTLSSNIYKAGQASAYYPSPMHGSNNPSVPMNIGFATDGPIALSPDIYTHTPGQVSAINPLPMPTSNNALIPVDGPPIQQRALCTQCPRTFSRQSDLERHAKKHLPGPKEFKCHAQGCKYESHRKDKLVEHMRRRHPAAGNHAN